MQPVTAPQCKWILAVLARTPTPGLDLWKALETAFGAIDYKGAFVPFEVTDYYRDEFGSPLWRAFVSFRGLASPDLLPDLKHSANRVEANLASVAGAAGKRIFNLDIGYMDPDKLVLASFKAGPCKLYLRDGVYADLLLKYADRRFEPMPWAFADFQDDRYHKSLLVIREKLKSELRKAREPSPDRESHPDQDPSTGKPT